MALLQRSRVLPQQRIDLPDYENIENFICADFKAIHKNIWSKENFVFSGFEATGTGTTDLAISLAGSSCILGEDDGVVFIGAPSLSALTTSSLTPSSTNYVEISIGQDTGGADSRAFWDQTAAAGEGGEFSQIIDTYTFLEANLQINTTNFTGDADKLPICEVDVNGAGVITEIRDSRNLFYRLGRRSNTSFKYSWTSRTEPTDTQFSGADKDITSLKQFFDALMSRIAELAGTDKWYELSNVSIVGTFRNTALSAISGIGSNTKWSWDGSNLSLTDDNGTPSDSDEVASIRLFDSTANLNLTRMDGQGGSSTIALADGEVLWVELPNPLTDVSYDDIGLTSLNYRISARGSVPNDETTFWLAYREGNNAYLRYLGELEPGETAEISDNINENILNVIGIPDETTDPNYTSTNYVTQNTNLVNAISELDSAVTDTALNVKQNENNKLIEGGTWSLASNGEDLTLSADAYIQVPGLNQDRNTIQSQTINLPNSNSVAYVEINRDTGLADNLTVNVANSNLVSLTDDTIVIARRTSKGILVGSPAAFLLKAGQYLELDGALAEIQRLLGQLRIKSHSDADKVNITDSNVDLLDGAKLSQVINTFELSFPGSVIDFTTGDVFESDGVTPLGNNFTPQTIAIGDYFWYGISLVGDALNANNQQTSKIQVDLASSTNSNPTLAPKPVVSGDIKLGFVRVFNNSGSIEVDEIIRFGVGSGSGSGDTSIKADYLDPITTTLPSGSSFTIDGQSLANGDTVLFTNLSSNNNRIYQASGVGSAITWEAQRSFSSSLDPSDGDSVRILKGDAFQEQLAVYDSTNFKVNDTVRFFDGVSANFWELSSIKTATLLNNTTGNLIDVAYSGSENMIISFSIARGVNKETGQIFVTTNGTDVSVSRQSTSLGATEVEFSGQINGANLEVSYELNNTGADATIKYFVQRWSNSPGGPTGIPNYNTSGSGSSTAAAGNIGDVQFHGGSGNLDADSRFKFDTATGDLVLDGLRYSVLKGPVTLNDATGSPTTILSYATSSFNFAIIEYSIKRGTNYRVGRLLVTNSGSVVDLTDDNTETGVTGVTFSAIINSGNVEIQYTTTSTGNDADYKYTIKKWA